MTAADQPLPRALTALATACSVALPAHVTDVSVVVVPLATRVYARHGYVPIYMDLVTERPLPLVRIPHYRPVGNWPWN